MLLRDKLDSKLRPVIDRLNLELDAAKRKVAELEKVNIDLNQQLEIAKSRNADDADLLRDTNDELRKTNLELQAQLDQLLDEYVGLCAEGRGGEQPNITFNVAHMSNENLAAENINIGILDANTVNANNVHVEDPDVRIIRTRFAPASKSNKMYLGDFAIHYLKGIMPDFKPEPLPGRKKIYRTLDDVYGGSVPPLALSVYDKVKNVINTVSIEGQKITGVVAIN